MNKKKSGWKVHEKKENKQYSIMAQTVRAEELYGYIASTNTEEAKENEKAKEGRKTSGYWSLIVREEAVILENKKQDGRRYLFFFFLVAFCLLFFAMTVIIFIVFAETITKQKQRSIGIK